MPGDFNFRNLTPDVRPYILNEMHSDLSDGVLYVSDRLTDAGKARYPDLLRTALTHHTEAWLVQNLVGLFNAQEFKAGVWKTMARNAHTLLGQCEFNLFYIRGLCSYAIANPTCGLRIYRARESSNPRPESEAKIGRMVDSRTVLNDLRSRIGTGVEFGLPEVNSGLSLELVPHANAI